MTTCRSRLDTESCVLSSLASEGTKVASWQGSDLEAQGRALDRVFVLGGGAGDLGLDKVELGLVEFHDRADAIEEARLSEIKGPLGVGQELARDLEPIIGILDVEPGDMWGTVDSLKFDERCIKISLES